MPRRIALACALVLGMLVAPGPAARAQQPTEPRRLAAERLLEQMLGVPVGPMHVEDSGTLTSYYVDLTPELRRTLGQRGAANLQALSAGRSLSMPTSISSAITGATIACTFSYYWWFGYVNLGATTTSKVTRSLKGPGQRMNNKGNVGFTGGTVGIKFENARHSIGEDNAGVYTYQAKGIGKGGGGKTKQRYLGFGTGC